MGLAWRTVTWALREVKKQGTAVELDAMTAALERAFDEALATLASPSPSARAAADLHLPTHGRLGKQQQLAVVQEAQKVLRVWSVAVLAGKAIPAPVCTGVVGVPICVIYEGARA